MTHLPASSNGKAPAAGTETREVLTETRATEQLAAVLALAEGGALRCSAKTQKPSAATVKLLTEALPYGDFYDHEAIVSFAWPLLIQAGGIADGSRLQLTPRGRSALQKEPAEVLALLWRRWIKNGVIDEFSRIEAVKGQQATNVLSAAGRRRATAADSLHLLPAGEWVEVDDLFARMQKAGMEPTVHRSERGLWKLYLEDPQYGSFGYDGSHKWELLEGRYVLAVLFEYAATLGLIDVRYIEPDGARTDFRDHWGADWLPRLSRYDGLQALRITALGQYCLGPARSR